MPFVEAKCTNCGAVLPVDNSRDAWVCGYCNTPFIVEKAIQQFSITNNISASVVNVIGGDTADVMFNRALEWLALQDEAKAIQVLNAMTGKYPSDIRGWSKLARLSPSKYNVDNAVRLGDSTLIEELIIIEAEKHKKREAAAQAICDEIRNGRGAGWITTSGVGFVFVHEYKDFPCVQQLEKEAQENAEYFNRSLRTIRNDATHAISLLWEVKGPYSYNMRVRFIIGNVICYTYQDEGTCAHVGTCNQTITKAVMQKTFQEIESRARSKQKLCLYCGHKLKKKSQYGYSCASCNLWVSASCF